MKYILLFTLEFTHFPAFFFLYFYFDITFSTTDIMSNEI